MIPPIYFLFIYYLFDDSISILIENQHWLYHTNARVPRACEQLTIVWKKRNADEPILLKAGVAVLFTSTKLKVLIATSNIITQSFINIYVSDGNRIFCVL